MSETIRKYINLCESGAEVTYDEATEYVKQHYPVTKSYIVPRLEPGFRAAFTKSGKMASGYDVFNKSGKVDKESEFGKNLEKHGRRIDSQISSFNAVIQHLGLKQNAMLSGSTQVTNSLGYSWQLYEGNDIAILYYEDRGMGSDGVLLAAKNTNLLLKLKTTVEDAGVIPSSAEMKAKRDENRQKRLDIIKQKGLVVGMKLDLSWQNITNYGVIAEIKSNGSVVVEITKAGNPNYTVGEKLIMKPGSISKAMITKGSKL
jgi:hypothetical protein